MAEISQSGRPGRERPLSPHLQVYKPLITMVMSILHRITGAALYLGTLLVVWWLAAAAAGPEYFDWVIDVYGSILGVIVIFGFSWALIHHMLGGIRHLVWDTGTWLEKETAQKLAVATIAGSLGLTVLLWLIVLVVK